MKITAVESVQVAEYSNLVWVELHTDEGLVGLGETFRNPAATVAYLQETCAPYLLGKDPLRIERHARALMSEVGNRFMGFPSRSVEVRGNSAVDLALWDLFGKAAGLPLLPAAGRAMPRQDPHLQHLRERRLQPLVRAGDNSLLLRPDDHPTDSDPLTTWPRSTSGRPSSRARCSRTASRR